MINGDFLTSEIGLQVVSDTEFELYSWHLGEFHNDQAVDLFIYTLYNLYRRHVIAIKEAVREKKVFLFTTETASYKVQLGEAVVGHATTGWLEALMVKVLQGEKPMYLEDFVIFVLNEVFGPDKKYDHPGKIFLCKGLKMQKCYFFRFHEYTRWFKRKVAVWQGEHQMKLWASISVSGWEPMTDETNLDNLRNIIEKQLMQFQETGD